jgi:hypothetical protein
MSFERFFFTAKMLEALNDIELYDPSYEGMYELVENHYNEFMESSYCQRAVGEEGFAAAVEEFVTMAAEYIE